MSNPLNPTDAMAFTRKVVQHCLADGELSYEDFVELAEECGLIATVAYDPEGAHADVDVDEAVEGDPILLPTFDDRDGE